MPTSRFSSGRSLVCTGVLGGAMLLALAGPALAQQQQQPAPAPAQTAPAPTDSAAPPQDDAADAGADSKNRIFGVMPNYTTVEGVAEAAPVTTAQSFKMAALDSFDPFVYPLFGFVAAEAQWQHEPQSWDQNWNGYARRYGLAFADNTMCSLITTGLMPSLLKQDPRYYQGRVSGVLPRLGYAVSRSAVTKSRTGHTQFNLSEIGGTFVVAGVSNLYYPSDERTMDATLQRWAMQAMWDSVANELKEFWPDMRKVIHRH